MFCFLVVDDGAPYQDVCALWFPLPDRGGVRAAVYGQGALQEQQGQQLEALLNPMVQLEPTGEVTPDLLGNQRSERFDRLV